MDIAQQSAIVTGGASGLGAATARALAGLGAHVVVLDVNDDLGETVAKEIAGTFVHADVADEGQVGAAVDAASAHGPLRVLVNCAGLTRVARTVDRAGRPYKLEDFEFVLRVNLTGTFNCLRLAAATMSQLEPTATGDRGVIVSTASNAAFDGQIGQVAYSASKAAIVGMTLPIARDLAAHGIRVNTIAPGLFETPIYEQVPNPEQFKAKLAEDVVFPKRFGDPAEFADLVVSVVRNGYLNGETLRLDGALRLPPG